MLRSTPRSTRNRGTPADAASIPVAKGRPSATRRPPPQRSRRSTNVHRFDLSWPSVAKSTSRRRRRLVARSLLFRDDEELTAEHLPGDWQRQVCTKSEQRLSLIHISEPTRLLSISYAV